MKRFSNGKTKLKKTGIRIGLAVLLSVSFLFQGISSAAVFDAAEEIPVKGRKEEPASDVYVTRNYRDLLSRYEEEGCLSGTDRIRTDDWTDAPLQKGLNGYDGKAFHWMNGEEAFSVQIQIQSAGLYLFALDYLTYQDDQSSIQRGILIDGASYCMESETCPFPRSWKEDGETYLDANGDEKPASMIQVPEWRKQYFTDTNAVYSEPLRFYLCEGTHTVTVFNVSGRMCVGAFHVEPVPEYPDYQDYFNEHGHAGYGGEPLLIEAETAVLRSERTIRRISDPDPESSPFVYSYSRLNAIGGNRWQRGWQTLTWELNVPETALYRVDLRVLQKTGEGLTVYRQLKIDGEVPFKEALALPFAYANDWQTVSLGDGEEPYYLYLEEGIHTLSLSVVSGGLSDTVMALKDASSKLSSLLMDINMIVGTDPDRNFNYELDKKISWLIPTLSSVKETLSAEADRIRALTGKQTTLVLNLKSAVSEIEGYIRKPKTISNAAGTDGSLTSLQTNLASWYSDLLDTPLTLDTITLSAPGSKVVQRKSSFFQRMKATVLNFFASFTKDYNSIADDRTESDRKISVWIARGREWGEALQKMCDEEFTPRTGIKVEINILPSGSVGVIGSVSPVLLSLVSGNSPNVCIGSDSTTPVELAIRDSIVDLSKLDGYEDLVSHFVDGAMEPLTYNGGTFALPENMDFQFMIYRKDILESLNLQVPDTWDELYTGILPTLKQNNYEFYIPITTSTSATYQYCAFYTYLYQRGGDIYAEDGLSTMLDSDVSLAAFKQWSENYTRYNMPREINVFNHFRIGDVPIFIGGLNEYLNLKVAAPELAGKWGVALIPGTVKADGETDRSAIGALTTSFIFDKTEEENALSWEFLKWYMSTDVQYRYGEEIEAEVGMAARWFTANKESFELLSWDTKDLAVFRQAMTWMRNPRNVLGGYMTGRQLNNAWTRVVMNGQNYIESLEDAIEDIEAELKHKQEEYGIGGRS